MIRKIVNILLILIVCLFAYKLYEGDFAAMIAGALDLVMKIGDYGSDVMLDAWAKIKSS